MCSLTDRPLSTNQIQYLEWANWKKLNKIYLSLMFSTVVLNLAKVMGSWEKSGANRYLP